MRLYTGKIPLSADLTYYKKVHRKIPFIGKTVLTEDILDEEKTLYAHGEYARSVGLVLEDEVLKMNGKLISGKLVYHIDVFKEK